LKELRIIMKNISLDETGVLDEVQTQHVPNVTPEQLPMS
jgi:hypothetical protein